MDRPQTANNYPSDGTLLVALRPEQVLNDLASRVGRETYFGMIFWMFNSALVGSFGRDTFDITYRSRGTKSILPRLTGSVRAVPRGTLIRYHVNSNMTFNLVLVGLIGLAALGMVALALIAPYMPAPNGAPPPTLPSGQQLTLGKSLQMVGIVLFFVGGIFSVSFFTMRAQAKALANLLPRMYADWLVLDPQAAEEVVDVLPAEPR
jgi:hypothetical protein